MHIPDNYLSPQTDAVMAVAMVPVWVHCIKKVRATLDREHMAFLGICAAFSFLLMMFNVPLPGGTTGHAVGGALIALLLGPEAAAIETERKLENYRLVIIGTPVWAGRCSSVVRSFLKQHGKELNRVAYVLTRSSDRKSEDVYRQMDLYTAQPHRVATSLRVGHVGHTFWQEEFLRQLRELLESNG